MGERMEEWKAMLNDHMDQVASVFESVSADLRSQWRSGNLTDPILGFFHAVDWTELWLIAVIVFHLTLVILAVGTRKRSSFQMGMFLITLAGVYFAERLNTFLRGRWETFARQNYFDKRGVFLSSVWSGPLLIISVLILFNTIRTLCQLMIQWKKAELRHRVRMAQKKTE